MGLILLSDQRGFVAEDLVVCGVCSIFVVCV